MEFHLVLCPILCLVNRKEITLLLSCSQLHPDEVSKIISQTRGSSDNDLLIKKHRKSKPKWSGKPQQIWKPRSTKGQRSISLLKKLLEEYNFDVWSWNSTLNLRPYAHTIKLVLRTTSRLFLEHSRPKLRYWFSDTIFMNYKGRTTSNIPYPFAINASSTI